MRGFAKRSVHKAIRWARRYHAPEWDAAGLCALLAIGLANNWKWLRGPEERRWRYYSLPGIEDRVRLTIVICALVGLLAIWLMSRHIRQTPSRRRTIGLLAFLLLGSLSVQLALLYLEHPDLVSTLFYRTVSIRNLGAFFFDASHITDVEDTLRRFPELMPTFQALSPQTHPPGLQLVFWGASQLLNRWPDVADTIGAGLRTYLCNDPSAPVMALSNASLASAAIQMLTPVWTALTVLPLYALARRLADEHTALRAAVLFLFIPSVALFGAHWDHVYTLIAASSLYILHVGLESRRWWPFLIAGLLVSIASFFSLGNLAIGFMLAVFGGAYWVTALHRQIDAGIESKAYVYRTILKQTLSFAAGAASVWSVYFLAYGVTPIDILRAGIDAHARITGHRTYAVWLGYNLFDFFLFLGVPVVLALIVSIRRSLSRPNSSPGRSTLTPLLAFGVTLVALDVAGLTRGEVARLWMFLVPTAVLAALPALADWSHRTMLVMSIVLVAQVVLIGYYMRTIGHSDFPFYVPRQTQVHTPAISHPVQATLGENGEITLLGYDLSSRNLQPGDTITLTLYWQANRRLPHSYTVFLHLLDEMGQVAAQSDGPPRDGQLPTTCWLDEEIVADEHSIALDAVAPGQYTLQAGMYRLDLLLAGDPSHRLPVAQSGSVAGHATLESISVVRATDTHP